MDLSEYYYDHDHECYMRKKYRHWKKREDDICCPPEGVDPVLTPVTFTVPPRQLFSVKAFSPTAPTQPTNPIYVVRVTALQDPTRPGDPYYPQHPTRPSQ